MIRNFLYLVFFLLFFKNVFANDDKNLTDLSTVYDEYDECIYINTKKGNTLIREYDLYDLVIKKSTSPFIYECNKIFSKIINSEEINFKKIIESSIQKNEGESKNKYIKIYKKFHRNIIFHSKNINEVKNSLDELENNYFKKSNVNINQDAAKMAGTLGWFYYVHKDLFNFEKAEKYLSIAVEKTKDHYSLKYYQNNLGIIYDQDRNSNFTKKKNNKIAFDLYSKAAKLGLHHAYGNLGKFYILGLGGIKPDYDKAIKNYKLKRISSFGDDNFSDIKILYSKQRLPKNLDEYLFWLEEYLVENQDSKVFQQLAWFTDEDESSATSLIQHMRIYKWQYLCFKYCESYYSRERSESELSILKTKHLSKDQINEAIKQADLWEKSNWNKEIKKFKKKTNILKKKDLVDLIKNALIRNEN